MFVLLFVTLFGLLMAGTFGSRLMLRDTSADTFFTKWVRNPLKSILPERAGRMMDDGLLSWAAFIMGLWIAIPPALANDRWPMMTLIIIAILAYARAGKTPDRVTHDIDGTAVDMTPKSAPADVEQDANPPPRNTKTA
jgi:hypothetical protein